MLFQSSMFSGFFVFHDKGIIFIIISGSSSSSITTTILVDTSLHTLASVVVAEQRFFLVNGLYVLQKTP